MTRCNLAAAAAACALLATVVTTRARADGPPAEEARPSRRNTVSTNPVRYGLLHFQIEYERIVADRWSLFVAPIYFHHAWWYPFARAHEMTANGFGADFGFRYTFANAPAGVFVGPLLSAYRGEVLRAGRTTLEGYVLSAGVQVGYTWLIDRWLLSAGGGLSYGIPTERAPEPSPRAAQLPHQGLWLNLRANVGFVF
jgi:hypothetical protein